AIVATLVAIIPPDTYAVNTKVDFPPQHAAPMSLSCQGHELAESWSIASSNPAESAVYTSGQTPIIKDNVRVGYTIAVLNAAGVQRPTVKVTLEVVCQHEHSRLVQLLLWPVKKIKSLSP